MTPIPEEPQPQVSKKRPGPLFKKNGLPFKFSGKCLLTIFRQITVVTDFGRNFLFAPFCFVISSSAELNWVSISSSIALSPCFNKLTIPGKKVLGSIPPHSRIQIPTEIHSYYLVNMYSHWIDTVVYERIMNTVLLFGLKSSFALHLQQMYSAEY